MLDIALFVGVQIILSQMQVCTDEMRENYINPTCSLYAYNSLILKYRFFLSSEKCTTQIFRLRFKGGEVKSSFLYKSESCFSGSVHCRTSTWLPSIRFAIVLTTICVPAILITSCHDILLPFC